MAITKLERDLNIISALDNEPNDVSGMTADDLKAKFDEGNKAIQEYINETLIPETEAAVEEVRGEIEGAVDEATKNLESQLRGVVLGQIPDDTITAEKLAPDVRERSYTKEETDAAIETADKVGDIKTTLRNDLGDKWLPCDGREIDKEQYPKLHGAWELDVCPRIFGEIVANGSVLDVYIDTDLLMFLTNGGDGKTLTEYTKHRGGEWESREICTDVYNIVRAKISFVDGFWYVAYQTPTSSSGQYMIYGMKRAKDESAWSAKIKITSDSAGYEITPIQYDGQNYFMGFTHKQNSYGYIIYKNTFSDYWSLGLYHSSAGGNVIAVAKALDGSGNYAVWQYYSGGITKRWNSAITTGGANRAEYYDQYTYTAGYAVVKFFGDEYYICVLYSRKLRNDFNNDQPIESGIEIRKGKGSLSADSVHVGFIRNVIEKPMDMIMSGGKICVMTESHIYEYEIETGETTSYHIGKTITCGKFDFEKGQILAANGADVYQSKPCVPKLSVAGANTFIKAKM